VKFGALADMVLTSWAHRVTGEGSIIVDLVCEQVVIARGVSVAIPVTRPRLDKQTGFASRTSSGAQGTKNVPTTDAAGLRDRSTLYGLRKGLGG
jgi:hypothetical protein